VIAETVELDWHTPWRFALVPANTLPPTSTSLELLHQIDGSAITCMRTFHAEVAADFFFASHYNCDPNAPLLHLNAPLAGRQVVIWWRDAAHLLHAAPDDWQAILHMFRAAMATLHPQGLYLRIVFPTDDPARLRAALISALTDGAERAGVGFDYAAGHSQFDILHETKSRLRPPAASIK
jgi:hypothetical protein